MFDPFEGLALKALTIARKVAIGAQPKFLKILTLLMPGRSMAYYDKTASFIYNFFEEFV